MRTTACSLAALALLLATPSLTTAQERKGFWIGVSAGGGSASVHCDTCDEGRDAGAAWNIRLGWTANERLLIGGEVNSFAIFGETKVVTETGALEEDVPANVFLFNVLGSVTFYPKPSSGFFVKGGAGPSSAYIDVNLVGSPFRVVLGTGLGLLAGAGYDLRVARRISVTPAVNFWYSRLGDTEVSGGTLKNWKQNVLDVHLGITFH